MKPMAAIRLENLRIYLKNECAGNKSELARRAGKKQSFISDVLRGKKSFGEKVARSFEAELKLRPGSLDQPTVGKAAPATQDNSIPGLIARKAARLDRTAQVHLLNLVETMVNIADPGYWKAMAKFRLQQENRVSGRPIKGEASEPTGD